MSITVTVINKLDLSCTSILCILQQLLTPATTTHSSDSSTHSSHHTHTHTHTHTHITHSFICLLYMQLNSYIDRVDMPNCPSNGPAETALTYVFELIIFFLQ